VTNQPKTESSLPTHEPGAISRREALWLICACAFTISLLLSPALLKGNYVSPADMLFNYYPWREVTPPGWRAPGNDLLVDSVTQFEPWLRYSAERLWSGHLPLWNSENMLGAPFIGNMQSSIFAPLNWIYFLWPHEWVLFLRVWLKLFISAVGMYVLARQAVRVSPLAAAVAAATFTFSSYMINWLLHPHTASAMLLPWLWWATARIIRQPSIGKAVLLAILVALDVFAGHPETTYHLGVATSAFALLCAWSLGSIRLMERVKRLGMWALGYSLGALVSLVQVLPFLEYSSQSMALLRRTERADTILALPLHYAWTMISPDLFGNPALRNWWGKSFDYNSTNIYSGLVPLVLIPVALTMAQAGRRRFVLFLLSIVLICLAVIFRVPVVSDIAFMIPGMRLVFGLRLVLIVGFAVGLLAAFGMEALIASTGQHRRRLASTLAVSILGLGLLGVLVPAITDPKQYSGPADPNLVQQVWSGGLWRAAILLILIAVLFSAIIVFARRQPQLRSAALWLLLALTVADMLQVRSIYIPTISPEHYFPSTPSLTFIARQSGLFRTTADPGVLFPNTNLQYGISDLRGYDAVENQLYYDLVTRAPRIPPSVERKTATGFVPSPILDLLNVRYLLSSPGGDPNYVVDVQQESSSGVTVGEIAGGLQPGQTFVAQSDDLAQIQVLGATYGGRAKGKLIFHLRSDITEGKDIVTKELDAGQLPNNSYWVITFEPVREAKGRSFYFYLESVGAQPGEAATLWYSQQDSYTQGTRTENGTVKEGDLAFRALSSIDTDATWFKRVHDGGYTGASVFENTRALPRAWLTHRAEVYDDRNARLLRLRDPQFDPRAIAILNAPLPLPLDDTPQSRDAPADNVDIVRYDAEEVTIETNSTRAGVLVLADLFFPGWKATIDGQETPIFVVDHALRGVYLPSGAHTVRFEYRPVSFYLGLALTSCGLLIMAVLILGPRFRRLPR